MSRVIRLLCLSIFGLSLVFGTLGCGGSDTTPSMSDENPDQLPAPPKMPGVPNS